jgi:hypothetical protein
VQRPGQREQAHDAADPHERGERLAGAVQLQRVDRLCGHPRHGQLDDLRGRQHQGGPEESTADAAGVAPDGAVKIGERGGRGDGGVGHSGGVDRWKELHRELLRRRKVHEAAHRFVPNPEEGISDQASVQQ